MGFIKNFTIFEKEGASRMDNLYITATKSSPTVHFNSDTHILDIRGESYPEDTAEFYTPVLLWLEEYLNTSGQQQAMTLNLEMYYLNSSSSKVFMDMLAILDDKAQQNREITVNWWYDNETMRQTGEEFQEDCHSVHFHVMKKDA